MRVPKHFYLINLTSYLLGIQFATQPIFLVIHNTILN
jgi:hypothetical protein